MAEQARNRRPPALGVGFALFLLVGLFWLLWSPAKTQAQPPMPHTVEGRADCLACHGPSGLKPVPADHVGRPVASCLTCHPSVVLKPTEVITPTQTSSILPKETPAQEPTPPVPQPTVALSPGGLSNEFCMSCHRNPSLATTLPSGEQLPVYIDGSVYASSVHGDKLACTDCHTRITTYPHPKLAVNSRREYAIANFEACKKCHFANYTRTLDSVHYDALAAGRKDAPLCTDCHRAHNVVRLDEPRTRISDRCGQCHTAIYEDYAQSVHGKALYDENNVDVPVCITCHGVHSIQKANSAAFRIQTAELCGRCHSDPAIMDKYSLSTQVLKTYLDDFHGKVVTFLSKEQREVWPTVAVCTDCHGVHNILPTNNPDSPVIRTNLVSTCRQCHPDATENFPTAWLSHYDPSPQRSPLVFYVRLFYWIIIPTMVGGMLAHIFVDLWRVARNR
ncbi:MAG: cytochrome C [Chloroflexi bacterium]|nr:cytochrome C [Chloroflexota bacterium]